jgi:hypothetical protein
LAFFISATSSLAFFPLYTDPILVAASANSCSVDSLGFSPSSAGGLAVSAGGYSPSAASPVAGA